MAKKKKKKILLVLVEGPSEETALGHFFVKFFEQKNLESRVHVLHMDITTEDGVSPSNIRSMLLEKIDDYLGRYYLERSDVENIIQIVDTDGAYISDSKIVEDSACEHFYYTENEIRSFNPKMVVNRNKRKRMNLNALCKLREVGRMSYRVYYMSCNLDHVLYNLLNISDEKKRISANDFLIRYQDDLQGFIDLTTKSSFSVMKDYKDSWEYIKNHESLKRHSNIGLVFYRCCN